MYTKEYRVPTYTGEHFCAIRTITKTLVLTFLTRVHTCTYVYIRAQVGRCAYDNLCNHKVQHNCPYVYRWVSCVADTTHTSILVLAYTCIHVHTCTWGMCKQGYVCAVVMCAHMVMCRLTLCGCVWTCRGYVHGHGYVHVWLCVSVCSHGHGYVWLCPRGYVCYVMLCYVMSVMYTSPRRNHSVHEYKYFVKPLPSAA